MNRKCILRLIISISLLLCLPSHSESQVIYRNPRVLNVDYSFELVPDHTKIDRNKDLKLWLPEPREWDSQRNLKIISIQPPPHTEYEDPEYGNKILYWDFGKGPVKESYKANIKYRLEIYEVHCQIEPELIGSFDKESEKYKLYTRSTKTTKITPELRELAQTAIGNEKNAYLQAKLIYEFVRKKMRQKVVRRTRGSGVENILDFPVTDLKTGEQYYEGACGQQSVFFVALCRAVGIPARGVTGMEGWYPGIKEKDVNRPSFGTILKTPDGLAGARLYGQKSGHQWAEFYLPEYGWIPVDPTWGKFGHQINSKLVFSKGRDVMIGPDAPQEESEGYGDQWIPIHKGRADAIGWGVWNIASSGIAKATLLHHSDSFPANGLAYYNEYLFPEEDAENKLRHLRKGILSWPSRYQRSSIPDSLNLEQFYNDYQFAMIAKEAFVCHMLRRQLGDEKFFKLVDTYVDHRQKSNQDVSTIRFQELAEDIYGEPLDWFFNQWVSKTEIPLLKIEIATATKDEKGWRVQGRVVQAGETTFRLPVELAIDTENGRELEKLYVENRAVDFDFHTQNEPQKLIVDPDYDIPKIQMMPPRLRWWWDAGRDLTVIYGTTTEADANKKAAERFIEYYPGLGQELIKADTAVDESDLQKCLILFGRPKTNKITQQFQDIFMIKFDGDIFNWQGIAYDQPTQGAAQIVENPLHSDSRIVLYTGLSGDATQKFCDLNLYDADVSYVIFDGAEQLVSGDWEEYDSNLVWIFD